MPTCSVINCTNRQFKGCGLTFHLFPFGRPSLLQQWITNLKRNGWSPNKRAVLCSRHFDEACFDKTGQTIRLREDAIPTIFNPPGWKARSRQQKLRQAKKPPQDRLISQTGTEPERSDTVPTNDLPSPKPSISLLEHSYSIQESPKAVKRKLTAAIDHIDNLHKKLKTTQQKSRRLKRKVKTLEEVVRSLQEKQLVSASCTEIFPETCSDYANKMIERHLES